jgi:hypothetical protein
MIAIMVCDDCDAQMEEIFTAQENFKLKGWMCPACLNFAPAIGRERKWTHADKEENDSRAS